jgi:enoyl-CoA hydratase
MTGTVLLEDAGEHVRVLRLNRPEQLNAISFELVTDLHDALDELGSDPDAKVAILTGTGRGFCAGLDLANFGQPPAPGGHQHLNANQNGQSFLADLTQHMRRTPQIMVAAVNGPAFGGGLSLSLACDLRVAARSASFCSAFIRTGLTGTDAGVSYLLPRLIGVSRGFDMIVTGRRIDAEQAERWGLVTQLFDDEGFFDAALGVARGVAGYTGVGLRWTKEVMWHNIDNNDMAACIALENRNQTMAGATDEVREYMAAYSQRITKKER